ILAITRLRTARQGSEPWPILSERLNDNGPPIRYQEIFPKYESANKTEPLPITGSPILWKDFNFRGVPAPLVFYILFFFIYFLFLGPNSYSTNRSEMNSAMRDIAPLAIAFVVFPVGLLSSRMVAKERESRTLETLLTTSLEPKAILRDKWLASVL